MNYLAHLYLSGNSEECIVGNFIGDYVKGKQYANFPSKVSEGILLHREIDTFTDTHPITKELKAYFRADLGLYSGIVIDFIYDHFLAKDWNNYSSIPLKDFTKHMHNILLSNFQLLPFRVQSFLPFLVRNKRLESYATVNGIIKAMEIMSRHTSLPPKQKAVQQILEENYALLNANFALFMNDIIDFVQNEKLINLQKIDSQKKNQS